MLQTRTLLCSADHDDTNANSKRVLEITNDTCLQCRDVYLLLFQQSIRSTSSKLFMFYLFACHRKGIHAGKENPGFVNSFIIRKKHFATSFIFPKVLTKPRPSQHQNPSFVDSSNSPHPTPTYCILTGALLLAISPHLPPSPADPPDPHPNKAPQRRDVAAASESDDRPPFYTTSGVAPLSNATILSATSTPYPQ